MLPNFIGIGAPKAGTTWIFQILRAHPEVFVTPVKETNFFDYDTIEGRLGEYEEHFAAGEGSRAIGEISTRYLGSNRGAPERIHRLLPEVRLFVILRNPADQIYSHYWHLRRQNFHEWDFSRRPLSFEEALSRHPDKLLAPADYHRHLRHWLSYFDRSQLLILFHDDLRSRPRTVLRTLFGFLGVDPEFQPHELGGIGRAGRQGTSPRHPVLERVYRSLYHHANRRVYHPMKRVIGTSAAVRLKDRVRIRHLLEGLFMRPGYPPMKKATRALLNRRFAVDVEKLAVLTGRDLSHWLEPVSQTFHS